MTGTPTFNAHEAIPFDKRPRVAICLPMGQKIDDEFGLALASLTYSTRYPLALIKGSSSMGAFEARNHILDSLETLERQLGRPFDFTFWLDSDMLVPPDALTGLMSRQKDVIGAGYVRRVPPHDLLVKPLPGERGIEVNEGIKEVAGLPGGCLLVKRALFTELEPPAWRVRLKSGNGHGGRHDGEDYLFFDTLRECGHTVWLDVDLTKVVGHIGAKTYYVEQEAEKPSRLILPTRPAKSIIGLSVNGRG